jgi:hypothetical protein
MTMGYKSIASELEKQNQTQNRPVLILPDRTP